MGGNGLLVNQNISPGAQVPDHKIYNYIKTASNRELFYFNNGSHVSLESSMLWGCVHPLTHSGLLSQKLEKDQRGKQLLEAQFHFCSSKI
jgi:hypothetical protein